MQALLLAGLGATHKNAEYYARSLFESEGPPWLPALFRRVGAPGFDLRDLTVRQDGVERPLLRPARRDVHLTTATLLSILARTRHTCTVLDLEDVWSGREVTVASDAQIVLLSTTFIWNASMLAQVMTWLDDHCPDVPVVLGGQY